MSHKKEQVTLMILNVDLKCSCCYKKVRKLLSKFPQIRSQIFDEEKNKVMITVVCCDPECIRDQLCCKGGRAIQSIEIPEPPPPPPPHKHPPPPHKHHPKPGPENRKQQPKKPDPVPVIIQPQPLPEPVKMPEPKPEPVKVPELPKQQEPVKMPEPKQAELVNMQEWVPMGHFRPPVSMCCPCYYGYDRPVPPYYGGCRPPCYVKCDYLGEQDPHGCSIM